MSYNINDFDGLEIAPFIEHIKGCNQGICERMPLSECLRYHAENPTETTIRWGIYGHLRIGGVDWIADRSDQDLAMQVAIELIHEHPSLSTHGIMEQ